MHGQFRNRLAAANHAAFFCYWRMTTTPPALANPSMVLVMHFGFLSSAQGSPPVPYNLLLKKKLYRALGEAASQIREEPDNHVVRRTHSRSLPS